MYGFLCYSDHYIGVDHIVRLIHMPCLYVCYPKEHLFIWMELGIYKAIYLNPKPGVLLKPQYVHTHG